MKAISLFLTVLLVFSTSLQAGPIPAQKAIHLVSIEELKGQISERTAERAENIREVQTLLRHQAVQDRLGHLYDLEQIAVALPTLDDQTLARLARESKQMNEQFQAGLLGLSFMSWVVITGLIVFTVLVLIHTYDRGEP